MRRRFCRRARHFAAERLREPRQPTAPVAASCRGSCAAAGRTARRRGGAELGDPRGDNRRRPPRAAADGCGLPRSCLSRPNGRLEHLHPGASAPGRARGARAGDGHASVRAARRPRPAGLPGRNPEPPGTLRWFLRPCVRRGRTAPVPGRSAHDYRGGRWRAGHLGRHGFKRYDGAHPHRRRTSVQVSLYPWRRDRQANRQPGESSRACRRPFRPGAAARCAGRQRGQRHAGRWDAGCWGARPASRRNSLSLCRATGRVRDARHARP